jgi:hypothetical protein
MNGRRIFGSTAFDRFGETVSPAGDVNGDGVDDIVIGAPFTNFGAADAGSLYIAFGSVTKGPSTSTAASLTGAYGLRLDGFDGDGYCAQRIRAAGDLNADGLPDVVVGCNYSAGGGAHRGSAHVLFGNAAPLVSDTTDDLASIAEDAASSATVSIAELGAARYLDLDPLAGAAITATPAGAGSAGHWSYRKGGTGSFTALPSNLSPINALVLGPEDDLRFEPNADYFGAAPPLGVRFWDGTGSYGPGIGADVSSEIGALGGFANDANILYLSLAVLAVNDPPAFGASDPPATVADSGLVEIPGWASTLAVGPPNESAQVALEYLVDQVSNPALFAEGPVVVLQNGNGTLRYQAGTGATGESSFRVRVRDNGGTANGGVDTSSPQTFKISVRPDLVLADGFE